MSDDPFRKSSQASWSSSSLKRWTALTIPQVIFNFEVRAVQAHLQLDLRRVVSSMRLPPVERKPDRHVRTVAGSQGAAAEEV